MKKDSTPATTHAVVKICLAIVLVSVLSLSGSFAQHAELLYDISESEDFNINEYSNFTSGNGRIYFVAHGRDLWTVNPENPDDLLYLKTFESLSELTIVGRYLYFAADDGSTGIELWRSDGTSQGTIRVKDIWQGNESSAPESLTNVRGTLYFSAREGVNGRELWKSNGTRHGTVMVKNIMNRGGNSNPASLTEVRGTLFFTANDGTHGVELWKSNGTASATVLVKDIRPGDRVNSTPSELVDVYGSLFFVAADPVAGRELWKSDGTAEGTVLVKDILPGGGQSRIMNGTAVYRTLYFSATDGVHGQELWKSDGTAAGTVMVKDLTPGPAGSTGTTPGSYEMGNFKNIYGTLFFTAFQKDTYYIWKSNGTEAGTIPLFESYGPGSDQPKPEFTFLNNRIYFLNRPADYEIDMYFMSMDRNGGDVRYLILFAESPFRISYYPEMALVNDMFYLSGLADPFFGHKVVRTDGTEGGAVILEEDVGTTSNGGDPQEFTLWNGKVYFRGNHSWYQQHDLWVTDGNPEGTTQHFNFDEEVAEFELIGNNLFASTFWLFGLVVTNLETREGGYLVPSGGGAPIKFLTQANGILFFANEEGDIRRSDGTEAGTFALGDFHRIIWMDPVGDRVMFRVLHEDNTEELWTSNGTVAGTVRVKTIRTGADDLYSKVSAVLGNSYYFVANNGINGRELWKSDGTEAGTLMVLDFNTTDPAFEEDIRNLVVFDGSLYISALGNDGLYGLYKSDGSASGTQRIGHVPPIGYSVVMTDKLYLFTRESMGGNDWTNLWTTDGTADGTLLVKDLNAPFGKFSHVAVDDVLYFSTTEEGTLRRTDGTACGTFEINVGTGGGASPLVELNNKLIFGSRHPQFGVEPHALDLSDVPGNPCGMFEEGPNAISASSTQAKFLSVYPNPFTNAFSFRLEGTENDRATTKVFTLYGKPVEDLGELSANTDHRIGQSWQPGVYILQVVREGRVFRHLVVKH